MHIALNQTPDGRGLRIGLVVSRYHDAVTGAMRDGAERAFIEAGGSTDDLLMVEAPGAFELPALAAAVAETGRVDAVVTLGCIITGETTHDRYIAHAVADGLTRLSIERVLPVALGVLTCQTIEQAEARAGGDQGNKGAEAMAAAIASARQIRALRGHRSTTGIPADTTHQQGAWT